MGNQLEELEQKFEEKLKQQDEKIEKVTKENRLLRRAMLPVGLIGLIGIGSLLWGDNVTVPHTFSGGTTVSSSQFNSNFSTIYDHVDKLSEVAILKEIQSTGTEGGTITSGSWVTRTLNTVEGVTSIVSLSSSQFTLQAGRYYIRASAPAYVVGRHKIRLRNISDSTTEIVGQSRYASSGGDSSSLSTLEGYIHLSTSKVFAIQHRVQTTHNVDGLGVASSFDENEVYTIVTIHRLPST